MVNYFTEDDGGSGGFARFLNPQGAIATLAGARHYRPVDELIAEQKARGNSRINNGVPDFNVVETVDVQTTTRLTLSAAVTLKTIFGWRAVETHILVVLAGTQTPPPPTDHTHDSRQQTT